MDKNSTLYQLMGLRMNGIMNGITEQDEDYQSLLQEVDKYSDSLEALHLPEETMKLIVMLVYKCGQKKLNNLYYQIKEQRR